MTSNPIYTMKFYKKMLCLFYVLVSSHAFTQNTLDNLGLTSSTPAAVAYSLRKLSSSYTGNAIQVRRSSDNTTQDIGFDNNGNLDTNALLAFVNGDNGFVSIWYDQSGNGRDLSRPEHHFHPQIVFNGNLKLIGSRVTIDFSGNKGLVYAGSLKLFSISTVIKSEATVWPDHHSILDASPRIGGILKSGDVYFYHEASQLAIWKNGISKTTSQSLAPVNEAMVLSISSQTYDLNKVFIGNYDGGGGGGSILETEAVAFSSLISNNDRLKLECNQGDYYSIITSCNTVINIQPSSTNKYECIGTLATPLAVEASGIDLTYQWYSNTTASNSGGALIDGATSTSITPSTGSVGTTYYYAEIAGYNGISITTNVSGAVIVDALPVVNISPSTITINSGDSVTLNASGASSYIWGFNNATPLDKVSGYKLAVGLRLLRSTYSGNAIRLRRASDNVEADFGFSGTNLNTSAITTWLNSSNAYCVKLYDQSGNGNDMIASTSNAQPLYVSDGLNNKPVLRFNTSQNLKNNVNFTPPYTVIYTAKQTGPSRGRVLNANNNWLLGWWNGSKTQGHFDGWVSRDGGVPADTNPYVYTGTGNGTESGFFENGISKTVRLNGGLNGPNGLRINENESSDADVAEIFVFDSVLSTNDRELVEKSSASYYGVYGEGFLGDTPSIPVSPIETTTYELTGYSANNGCSASSSVTVTVLKNPDLSNFNSQTRSYFDGSFMISPPSSISTAPITYSSSNTAVATISGTTVSITGTGTTTITATQESNATHFGTSISATLTVNAVSVLTQNGQISTSNFNYINKNGALATSSSLTVNGKIIATKSNDGLSAASAATSALQIKTDFPDANDGLYWIKNANINGGTPFQIYADMTTDGGGWTLILCNNNNSGWNASNAILRNETAPTINGQYSIIAYADYLKKSSSGFQYMMEATTRGHWGGIWTANQDYSFVKTNNTQTDVTINTQFSSWSYSNDGIEQRMPWYSPGSSGTITTSGDANGSWWGTLVSVSGYNPAPWLGCCGNDHPNIIWYWVR